MKKIIPLLLIIIVLLQLTIKAQLKNLQPLPGAQGKLILLDDKKKNSIINSSVYKNIPFQLTLNNGKTMTVSLNRTASLGSSEPVITKTDKAVLANEHPKPGWTTSVKRVSISAESTTFMNAGNQNSSAIVPGAIYSFESFMGGGFNEILPNKNPIKIYTDNALAPNGTGLVIVNNPTAAEILQGNGGANLNLIKNSIVNNPAGVNLISRFFSSKSDEEFSLRITGGGSYAGVTANANYNNNQTNNRFYFTVDIIKPMFTLKAERPINGFFNTGNSVPDKVYVKEVTYGTRILANVEITLNKREDIINFEANYAGAFTATATTNLVSKQAKAGETVNALVVGGPQETTILRKDHLLDDITTYLTTCTSQTAKPVSYSLGDMDGNTVATRSAVDDIVERNSVPDNLIYHLDEATVNISTGNDNKEWQSPVAIELYSGNSDDGHILMYQPIENSNVEFAINESRIITLTKHPNCIANDLLLENIKNPGSGEGLRLRIYYKANWATDAWKIENVSIKLKFVDQNGVPYSASENATSLIPSNGRAINFENSTGILDGFDRKAMECYLNKDFTSLQTTIKK